MSDEKTRTRATGLTLRFGLVLGLIMVPIALALASQQLASTPGPPSLPGDAVEVRMAPEHEAGDGG